MKYGKGFCEPEYLGNCAGCVIPEYVDRSPAYRGKSGFGYVKNPDKRPMIDWV